MASRVGLNGEYICEIGDLLLCIRDTQWGCEPGKIYIVTYADSEGLKVKSKESEFTRYKGQELTYWWQSQNCFMPIKDLDLSIKPTSPRAVYYLNIYKSLTNDKSEKEELTKLMEELK